MHAEVSRRRGMAEHDAWFRAEVVQALHEAGDPNAARIPHESVGTHRRYERAGSTPWPDNESS